MKNEKRRMKNEERGTEKSDSHGDLPILRSSFFILRFSFFIVFSAVLWGDGSRRLALRAVLGWPLRPGQVERGVHQADVRKRLGKVTQQPAAVGVILLRQ